MVKIRASPQRRERFRCQCVVLELNELQLIPDVKTRWNSTFDMIQRALVLKDVKYKLLIKSIIYSYS